MVVIIIGNVGISVKLLVWSFSHSCCQHCRLVNWSNLLCSSRVGGCSIAIDNDICVVITAIIVIVAGCWVLAIVAPELCSMALFKAGARVERWLSQHMLLHLILLQMASTSTGLLLIMVVAVDCVCCMHWICLCGVSVKGEALEFDPSQTSNNLMLSWVIRRVWVGRCWWGECPWPQRPSWWAMEISALHKPL